MSTDRDLANIASHSFHALVGAAVKSLGDEQAWIRQFARDAAARDAADNNAALQMMCPGYERPARLAKGSACRAFHRRFRSWDTIVTEVLFADNDLGAAISAALAEWEAFLESNIAALRGAGRPCEPLERALEKVRARDECRGAAAGGDEMPALPALWLDIGHIVEQRIVASDETRDGMFEEDGFRYLGDAENWRRDPIGCVVLCSDFALSIRSQYCGPEKERDLAHAVYRAVGWATVHPPMVRLFVDTLASWGPDAVVYELGAGKAALRHILLAFADAMGVADRMPRIRCSDDYSEKGTETWGAFGPVEKLSARAAVQEALERKRTGSKLYFMLSWARSEVLDQILERAELVDGLLLQQNSGGEGGYHCGYGIPSDNPYSESTGLEPLYHRLEEHLVDGRPIGGRGLREFNYARAFTLKRPAM